MCVWRRQSGKTRKYGSFYCRTKQTTAHKLRVCLNVCACLEIMFIYVMATRLAQKFNEEAIKFEFNLNYVPQLKSKTNYHLSWFSMANGVNEKNVDALHLIPVSSEMYVCCYRNFVKRHIVHHLAYDSREAAMGKGGNRTKRVFRQFFNTHDGGVWEPIKSLVHCDIPLSIKRDHIKLMRSKISEMEINILCVCANMLHNTYFHYVIPF